MRYVVVDFDRGTTLVNSITRDPIKYASRFEPIDVLGGKLQVWDETGTLYRFGPEKKLNKIEVSKNLSVVEVGKWGKDEPQLIETAKGQEGEVRRLLVDFLTQQENRKRDGIRSLTRLFRRGSSPAQVDYSGMSLKELIEYADSILKQG